MFEQSTRNPRLREGGLRFRDSTWRTRLQIAPTPIHRRGGGGGYARSEFLLRLLLPPSAQSEARTANFKVIPFHSFAFTHLPFSI